jgi:hypothetical protein
MDRKQLVTIAITAATSVIAKEVISWLVALARNTAQTHTVKAKTRTIFSKSNLRTLASIAFFVFTVILFWARMHETTPVTRSAVAWVVVSMFNMAASFSSMVSNVLSRIEDWKERRFKMVHPSVPVLPLTVSGNMADSQQTPDTPDASPESF